MLGLQQPQQVLGAANPNVANTVAQQQQAQQSRQQPTQQQNQTTNVYVGTRRDRFGYVLPPPVVPVYGYRRPFLSAYAPFADDRAERDLNDYRAPRPREIRYLAHQNTGPNLDPILTFSMQRSNNPATTAGTGMLREFFFAEPMFPRDNVSFWNNLHGCQSEQQSRNYILSVKQEIERMINDSDISAEYKQKFHVALNTHTDANDMRGVAVILGAIIFVATASICVSLITTQASVAACLASAVFCGLASYGPYHLADNAARNANRYFPTDRGAICEAGAFRNWVGDLNRLVREVNASPRQGRAGPTF